MGRRDDRREAGMMRERDGLKGVRREEIQRRGHKGEER